MKKINFKLTDFSKVLVSYLKYPDKQVAVLRNESNDGPQAIVETIHGGKRGVVVAIAPGIIGWSLCNNAPYWTNRGFVRGDEFNKELGLSLALQRAKIAESLDLETRVSFYNNVPFTLAEKFNFMLERADVYFNKK